MSAVVPFGVRRPLFRPGERVVTAGYGPGAVVKDERVDRLQPLLLDRVWVLLDAGANPQPFGPGEIRRTR